jgi:hypothetical protein
MALQQHFDDEVKTNRFTERCFDAACSAFFVAATTGVITRSGSGLKDKTVA